MQASAKPQLDSHSSELTVDFSLVVRLSLLDIARLLYSCHSLTLIIISNPHAIASDEWIH